MRFCFLFAAILFAGWRTRKSLGFAAYFFAQGSYMLATEYALLRHGETSLYYAWTYAVFTGLILITCLALALPPLWERSYHWRALAIAFVLALTLAHIAFKGLDHPVQYYDYIGITEGSALFLAGMIMAGVSYWTGKPLLFLILGLLWLAQCWFRIGFYMHVTSEAWLRANWMVPTWIGIIGFSLVGSLAGVTREHLRADRRMSSRRSI
jgi:hypothetical protein